MEMSSSSTFIVLPPHTRNGSVVFGKNSNRPQGEVQELIYEPSKEFTTGEPLKCTYIEVKQVGNTNGIVLSKPAWMWGGEMGANDQGVVIGNEAVWTKVKDVENHKGLLGTDLVRLALERCKSAEDGVDIITELLSEYGQGGCYSETVDSLTYHNSFLLCDAKEAWILETAGNHWVAQKITSGLRNISNCLSIKSQYDKISPDLIAFAKANGYWNGEGEFNFAAAFSSTNNENSSCEKHRKGYQILMTQSDNNNFGVKNMFDILRNSEVFNGPEDSFPTAACQVSLISENKPCCHWFTATPNPVMSVFKPFIFTPDVKISLHTKSPTPDELVTIEKPFDRRHNLYKLHANACSKPNNKVLSLLQEMEQGCLEEVEKFLQDFQQGQPLNEVDELLKDVVETEVKFYK